MTRSSRPLPSTSPEAMAKALSVPSLLHICDADGSGRDDLVIDFGDTYGLYLWKNDTSWEQIHKLSPASEVFGGVSGAAVAEASAGIGKRWARMSS